ncbi:hypothetical protein KFL_003230050 [Klebsormidium nitens]|uniref:Methyltransferase type 11 domain-containing protein n=1 Tax=Klebsormidium nitens TaxID=105231 RepID=A0A1Y1I7N8_KLENI|nr:hypothetical protein KFL_003230050 [Klebsormidium nitens]|eukprot:GAQ86960.1 hypothetical protein KFL_003230050 [Klebsormidium nitens]
MTIRVSEFDLRYWEHRHTEDHERRPEGFEWLASYGTSVVHDAVNRHFQKDDVILELGCGTSGLMHDLAQDGFSRLKAIDYSQAAIDTQNSIHGDADIDFRCMDVSNLEFENSSIDGIIDKSTLDSLDCCVGVDDQSAARRAVQEAYRVLRPRGRWIVISLRDPKRRVEDFEGLFRLVDVVEVRTNDASPCADYFVYCFEREA